MRSSRAFQVARFVVNLPANPPAGMWLASKNRRQLLRMAAGLMCDLRRVLGHPEYGRAGFTNRQRVTCNGSDAPDADAPCPTSPTTRTQ